MKMTVTRLFTVLCLTIFLLTGCMQPSTSSPTQSDDEADAIKSAVSFLEQMDWQPVDEDSQQATIQSIKVDDRYELIDSHFKGAHAWLITFPADSQRTIETPHVLVDPESNEVIGYLPSE
ncbi:MAG: hypothetical protein WBV10_07575 [Exiguobacterium marinum]|uniref:Peptidase propeptide and YPEB domain-containing protein n=2 Tax=Exiguobacterium marinum TaxID=273528 RepID=A0ABY7WWZ2_9BACL|nr:hypothetical protein [Exiguobacterium marinum]WDH74777.1 hypothetical protein PTI97_08000 [Exiguobacterium marinum]